MRDCQSYRETHDDPSVGVIKAASGAPLLISEVSQLPTISDEITRWRSRLLNKFGGPNGEPRQVTLDVPITKVDEDRHLVFGWASISSVDGKLLVDKQDDVITEEMLEQAAYEAMLQTEGDGDAMHDRVPVSQMVESMVFTAEKQAALGIDLGKVGWWVGYYVSDQQAWEGIKKGDYTMFSIEATAERVPVGAAA